MLSMNKTTHQENLY